MSIVLDIIILIVIANGIYSILPGWLGLVACLMFGWNYREIKQWVLSTFFGKRND